MKKNAYFALHWWSKNVTSYRL